MPKVRREATAIIHGESFLMRIRKESFLGRRPGLNISRVHFSNRSTQTVRGVDYGSYRFGELLELPLQYMKLLFASDPNPTRLLHGSLDLGLPLQQFQSFVDGLHRLLLNRSV
jgi:hypothetical protein